MAQKLQILIVEDEEIIAENLRLTLKKLGYEIAGVVNNAIDAIDILMNTKVDLAILDINIQGSKNGIWIANYIRKSHTIPYLFLTAFGDEKTILEATETRPYAYLLKPFVKESLMASIQIALLNANENPSKKETDQTLISKEDSIYIKHKEAYVKIVLKDICFLEADKNYIQIYTEKNKFLIRSTLSNVKKNLPENFMQVHRSFLVNIKKIDSIKGHVIYIEDYKISLSNSFKETLFKSLDMI